MPEILPEPTVYHQVLASCASASRHDGWTREVKILFCEVLAVTGRVIEAVDAVNRSGNTAYAQRRRDPLFAAAWQLALTEARQRLADALLERALGGSVFVQYDECGAVAIERRVHDNRLSLAVLQRLDRIAETGRATLGVPLDDEARLGNFGAPTRFEQAIARLAAAPERNDAEDSPDRDPTATSLLDPETHETHTHKDDVHIGGDIRAPLRALPPPHDGKFRKDRSLSYVD